MKNFKRNILLIIIVFLFFYFVQVFSQLSYHFSPEKAMESYTSSILTAFLPLKAPSVNDKITKIYGSYDISDNERLFFTKAGEYTDDFYVAVCKVEKVLKKEIYKGTDSEQVIDNNKAVFKYGDKTFKFYFLGEESIEEILKSNDIEIDFKNEDDDTVTVIVKSQNNTENGTVC